MKVCYLLIAAGATHEDDTRSRACQRAKALVALAFRNGPIEALHAGSPCPLRSWKTEFFHISDKEMKGLMKSAVGSLYRLLWFREHDLQSYHEHLAFGRRYTLHWDDPELKKPVRKESRPK
jgi:hypothetical protein